MSGSWRDADGRRGWLQTRRNVRGSGRAVVFVAGVGEPGQNWDAVLDSLQRLAPPVTTITYDRAGIGSSDPCPDPDVARPYGFFADQLHRLLIGLGVDEPIVLVGHSFGCLVARVFAARRPDRVSGLVLVEGSVAGMTCGPMTGIAATATRPTPR